MNGKFYNWINKAYKCIRLKEGRENVYIIVYNALLKQYRDNGVIIDVKNNDLSVKAPRGSLSQEQIEFLKLHKGAYHCPA